MRVGFDISQVAHPGGVANYTARLTEELIRIPDLEMKFFYSSMRKPYRGNLPHVKSLPLPPTVLEVIFNKVRLIPVEKFLGSIDIFHSSDWMQPPTKARKVTTYHDVVALKYPEWSNPKITSVHKRRLKLVEKEIDLVIAVSNATKKDLLELSDIPKEKIKVIYEGVDKRFKRSDETTIEAFKKKYNLPTDFILAIGGIGERRNLTRVKTASSDYNLVITGQTLPYLSDEEMPILYSAARMLLYPSFYEGFGLPILEAMACGTPVITSNVSSMPEVGGDAAVYVDPEDQGKISKEVGQVMEDKSLRDEMIKKGLIQAKKFTWEKCAKETYEAYKNLMNFD